MACMAKSSCAPQSHRADPNTSPVRHWEWTRTSAASSLAGLPLTRAIAFSVLSGDSKPKIRKAPNFVGKPASATFFATMARIISWRSEWSADDDEVVRRAGTVVGSAGNQAECGSCDLVQDRLIPTVEPNQFIHIAWMQDIRQFHDIGR